MTCSRWTERRIKIGFGRIPLFPAWFAGSCRVGSVSAARTIECSGSCHGNRGHVFLSGNFEVSVRGLRSWMRLRIASGAAELRGRNCRRSFLVTAAETRGKLRRKRIWTRVKQRKNCATRRNVTRLKLEIANRARRLSPFWFVRRRKKKHREVWETVDRFLYTVYPSAGLHAYTIRFAARSQESFR